MKREISVTVAIRALVAPAWETLAAWSRRRRRIQRKTIADRVRRVRLLLLRGNLGLLRRALVELPGVAGVYEYPVGAISLGVSITFADGADFSSSEYGGVRKNYRRAARRALRRVLNHWPRPNRAVEPKKESPK